jgi:hypothetical protein
MALFFRTTQHKLSGHDGYTLDAFAGAAEMKFRIVYYDMKEKEFTSKKTMEKFLKKHLDSEILRVLEVKATHFELREIRQFLEVYKHGVS